MDDESAKSMEPMQEVPLTLDESKLERLVRG